MTPMSAVGRVMPLEVDAAASSTGERETGNGSLKGAAQPTANGGSANEPMQQPDGSYRGGYLRRWGKQIAALVYKNVLLAGRNWRSLLLRLATPPLFIFLVWVIDKLVVNGMNLYGQFDDVPDPMATPIDPIPSCDASPFMLEPCWDFFYTPASSALAQELTAAIRENNPGRAIPADKVRGFETPEEVNTWLLQNQLQVLGAYHFDVSDPQRVGFTIQTNSTNQFFRSQFQHPTFYMQLPMQNAAEREIARHYFEQEGRAFEGWRVALKLFAHPPYARFSIAGEAIGPFVFAANMFGFVTLLSMLVLEKEAGLRQALRTMGMLDSAYWLSWMAYEAVLGLATSLFICAAGAACGFDLFTRNGFWVYWPLFLTFALAMTSFSMLLSVLVKRASSAVYMGFAIFILGWITQTAVIFGYPFSPDNISSQVIVTVVFLLMPWSLLVKGLVDLGKAVDDASSEGLDVGNMFSYCKNGGKPTDLPENTGESFEYVDYDCVLSLGQAIVWLLALWVIYFVLTVYLDNVLPNERGVRRPFYYFLMPDYWLGRGRVGLTKRKAQREVGTPHGKQLIQPSIPYPDEALDAADIDPDVAEEEASMKALLDKISVPSRDVSALDKYAVAVFKLQRVFRAFKWCGLSKKRDFWAVKGAWMGIEKGQLLCLLGPNGAGKTTTINMLTGVIPPSGGDALLYGHVLSSAGGIDGIRAIMGVCPQFDVLWSELTGAEHMRIYGLIKGLPRREAERQSSELLAQVKLAGSAAQTAGTYSGGMKRRLSVAIALLGDPKIVFLDEPTTGMDPISRRHVWDIIQTAKAGRAIVLTTHSMEEADILGDRVAIMARGRLRALGTSIRLKQRFGSGYQISVSCEGSAGSSVVAADPQVPFARCKQFFADEAGIKPADFTGAYMTFRVPQSQEGQLSQLLSRLESAAAELGVSDIQLSLTSLEEVFLNIAKAAEVEAAGRGAKATQLVHLEDGGKLEVPVGAETATEPQSGIVYSIQWVQDDSGNLQILSHKRADEDG